MAVWRRRENNYLVLAAAISGAEQMKQNVQFFKSPLEAGSKSESISIEPHVKIGNFTAEIN